MEREGDKERKAEREMIMYIIVCAEVLCSSGDCELDIEQKLGDTWVLYSWASKLQGRRKHTLVRDNFDQYGSGLCLCRERPFLISLSIHFARDHISAAPQNLNGSSVQQPSCPSQTAPRQDRKSWAIFSQLLPKTIDFFAFPLKLTSWRRTSHQKRRKE